MKQRLPYLQLEYSRHGRPCWYFRRNRGPRIRLPDAYGTPEFERAYGNALAGKTKAKPAPEKSPPRKKARPETLAWLVEQYREHSGDWKSLKLSTQFMRGNILARVLEKSGDYPFQQITRADMKKACDERAATPWAAQTFLKVMRSVFNWAVERGYLEHSPAERITVKVPKTEGHPTWTSEEMARFEARWPIGTRERLAYEIFKHTGFRRGDGATFGPQHVIGGWIVKELEKPGQWIEIPMPDELQRVIDASETGATSFITTRDGTPMVKESLGEWFKKACKAAGVEKARAHGIRKASAVEAAHAGATTKELMARYGWAKAEMAELYTRKAEKRRLAQSAANKVQRRRKREQNPAPVTG